MLYLWLNIKITWLIKQISSFPSQTIFKKVFLQIYNKKETITEGPNILLNYKIVCVTILLIYQRAYYQFLNDDLRLYIFTFSGKYTAGFEIRRLGQRRFWSLWIVYKNCILIVCKIYFYSYL